ncbi:MAG: sialate O-acetylesterase [Asticcacaulis sp.]
MLKRLIPAAALCATVVCAMWLSPAAADVRLPKIISDHMVLQAEKPVALWGWADSGEKVTVKIAGQTHRTAAGSDGRWKVQLKPLKGGSAPLSLSVAGKDNRLSVSDILVGEVWLASGQSNMEKPMRNQRGQKDVFDAEAELAKADYPQIRFFKVKRARITAPAEDVEGQWVICDPKTLDETQFSAAAYFFGRRIHTETKAPVGLIEAAWGGTRIEPWTAPEGFAAIPSLQRFTGLKPGAKVDGADVSYLYNGMIAPLAPYGLRGAIWYQGESNIIDVDAQPDYTDKMQALIEGWRKVFGQTFDFYYVQVAPHLYHVVRPNTIVSAEATPLLWEAQTDALRIPGTGMIVTTDLTDDLFDIHPRNKKDIGERLAGLALRQTYARQNLIVSGPRFRSLTVENGKATLSFDDIGGGLIAKDGKALNWFAISGADGQWYPAAAVIDGERIIVSSPKVPVPVAVRFAWDEAAQPNLFNKEGFPAWPFRTRP